MDSKCLELRCPLTGCLVKIRGIPTNVVVRLHRHLVFDHKVLKLDEQCPICKVVYSSKWYTRRHVKSVHLEPKKYVQSSEIEYSEFYKCKQCGKKISRQTNMIRHLQSHMKMMYWSSKRTDVTADVSLKQAEEQRFVKKIIREGKRVSMHRYSIFDVLGPKNSGYRVVPGLNNTISIQMTRKAATKSSIEISDVFFTNVNKEVVSVKDAITKDVIDINDSGDDVSVSEASDSGDEPVVVMDGENEGRNSKENRKNSKDKKINEIDDDLDSIEDLDSIDDIDIKEERDVNEEQEDLVAEIEQYMQEEDLLDELEEEIGTKTR